jgi:hypothetical protein
MTKRIAGILLLAPLASCGSVDLNPPVIVTPGPPTLLNVTFFHARDITYAAGRLIVTDPKLPGVYVLNTDGKKIAQFGSGKPGTGPGEFKTPLRTRGNASGYLAVFDVGNKRISVFGPDGKLTRTVPTLGSGFALTEKSEVALASGSNEVSIVDPVTNVPVQNRFTNVRSFVVHQGMQLEVVGNKGVLVNPFGFEPPTIVDMKTGQRHDLELPVWLTEAVRQRLEFREKALGKRPNRGSLHGLVKNTQITPMGTLWIVYGFPKLLGVEIDLEHELVTRVVVPKRGEGGRMLGAVLTDPQTLVVLRDTTLVRYSLAPTTTPDWLK